MTKSYDPKLIEALLSWVETGQVDEEHGAGYELAQAVRESGVEERRVGAWAVVHNDFPDLPLLFSDREGAESHVGSNSRLCPATIVLHESAAAPLSL